MDWKPADDPATISSIQYSENYIERLLRTGATHVRNVPYCISTPRASVQSYGFYRSFRYIRIGSFYKYRGDYQGMLKSLLTDLADQGKQIM